MMNVMDIILLAHVYRRTRLTGALSAGCVVEISPADAPAKGPAMSTGHDRVRDAVVGESRHGPSLYEPLQAEFIGLAFYYLRLNAVQIAWLTSFNRVFSYLSHAARCVY